MAKKIKNKNIQPLTVSDLKNEILYSDFEYKENFIHLCDLIPIQSKEMVEIEIIDKENYDKEGLIYVFVIDGRILKIGQSIGNIKSRIQSYNCGKTEYRISGTASTTNYFILQSFLKINQKINVYVYFPKKPEIDIFGEKIRTTRPVTKVVENKIIKDFIKKHGKKPIGLTQK